MPHLDRITAPLLLVLSEDDERYPPSLAPVAAMARIRRGRMFVIPAGRETTGHGAAMTLPEL